MMRKLDNRAVSPIVSLIILIITIGFTIVTSAVWFVGQYFIIQHFDLPFGCTVCLGIQIILFIVGIPLSILNYIKKRKKGEI